MSVGVTNLHSSLACSFNNGQLYFCETPQHCQTEHAEGLLLSFAGSREVEVIQEDDSHCREKTIPMLPTTCILELLRQLPESAKV
jgi:hypothetical protein